MNFQSRVRVPCRRKQTHSSFHNLSPSLPSFFSIYFLFAYLHYLSLFLLTCPRPHSLSFSLLNSLTLLSSRHPSSFRSLSHHLLFSPHLVLSSHCCLFPSRFSPHLHLSFSVFPPPSAFILHNIFLLTTFSLSRSPRAALPLLFSLHTTFSLTLLYILSISSLLSHAKEDLMRYAFNSN